MMRYLEKRREEKSNDKNNTSAQAPPAQTELIDPVIPEKPKGTKTEYPDWFNLLMTIYPPRSGSNDKRAAFKACNARIKEGYTVEQMVAATQRYRVYVLATGKLNTEYVKQAATFFGPGGHIDNDWKIPQGGYYGQQPTSTRQQPAGLAHDDTTWADELFGGPAPASDRIDQPGVSVIEGDFSRMDSGNTRPEH